MNSGKNSLRSFLPPQSYIEAKVAKMLREKRPAEGQEPKIKFLDVGKNPPKSGEPNTIFLKWQE